LGNRVPIISFSFDDFPKSALLTGGAILKHHGLTGTYYASFGLMGKPSPNGIIFSPEDVNVLNEQGHEWGCHTFSHCHSWSTPPRIFEAAIVSNRRALMELSPDSAFTTHSFPIAWPRPQSKRRAAVHFEACRGGGQTYNRRSIDLNLLSAFFLEKSRDDFESIERVIHENSRACGWLILATHDVCDTPSPFGCTPALFKRVVALSVASGATILPVGEALRFAVSTHSILSS